MRPPRIAVFAILLVAFVSAEVTLVMETARQVGWETLLAQQIAAAVFGLVVMIVAFRRYGAALRARLDSERPFDAPLIGGLLLLLAGFLLLLPGLISDVVGVALLVGPLRGWLAARLAANGNNPSCPPNRPLSDS